MLRSDLCVCFLLPLPVKKTVVMAGAIDLQGVLVGQRGANLTSDLGDITIKQSDGATMVLCGVGSLPAAGLPLATRFPSNASLPWLAPSSPAPPYPQHPVTL